MSEKSEFKIPQDSPSVPVVPDGVKTPGAGNTKKQRPNPGKHWCFTFNNYNEEDINVFLRGVKKAKRYVFQEEVGKKTGTPHLQGYVNFYERIRPIGLFDKRIHWEPCYDIKGSIKYCQKEDTRVGRVWRKMIKPTYIIKLPNLFDWEKEIIDILKTDPDPRKIYWFWNEDGQNGKSTFMKYLYMMHPHESVIISGSDRDMKNNIVNFTNKHDYTPSIVLLNITRSKSNRICYSGMEEIKDMFFFSGKYEGSEICGPPPHMIVCSNDEPIYEMMSKDRFVVRHIEGTAQPSG